MFLNSIIGKCMKFNVYYEGIESDTYKLPRQKKKKKTIKIEFM